MGQRDTSCTSILFVGQRDTSPHVRTAYAAKRYILHVILFVVQKGISFISILLVVQRDTSSMSIHACPWCSSKLVTHKMLTNTGMSAHMGLNLLYDTDKSIEIAGIPECWKKVSSASAILQVVNSVSPVPLVRD